MKKKRFKSCNVLETSFAATHIWHFAVEREHVRLVSEETAVPPKAVAPKKFVKDWHNLAQPRLNIAWLPGAQVFFRVIQLPAANREELLSMLEFQLEKLSPLPVGQIIWSVEVIPSQAENMQTAVVCIVARDVVEGFLGKLEELSYHADGLEVPQMNQILAGGVKEDGAWIYAGSGSEAHLCTVAWWSGGTLQQLQLLHLAVAESGSAEDVIARQVEVLHEQLMQIAWAGELEGWLTVPVKWHLVAEEQSDGGWEAALKGWSEEGVTVNPALSNEALAKFSAERGAHHEGGANLLPVEFATKYRQQYVDSIWMGSLGAIVAIYVLGALIYMVALNVYKYRQSNLQDQATALGPTYTNVLQLKERAQVLQEQLNLKYAALDSFKVTSELLPPDFTLVNLVFSRGRLQIYGTAPLGQETNVTTFNEQMRNAAIEGRPVFRRVSTPYQSSRPGSQLVNWNFDCEMQAAE